jgi:hypothetical protein
MKNNKELVKQIEKKIKDIIALIQTRKEELSTYESTLLELTQQLENIKQQQNMKTINKTNSLEEGLINNQ